MLSAAVGYYNGEHIVLNENVSWNNGQEVIVTMIPSKVDDLEGHDYNERIKELRACFDSFTDDFMADGREKFPSVVVSNGRR